MTTYFDPPLLTAPSVDHVLVDLPENLSMSRKA